MTAFIRKHHRVLFYASWILLGLIQSRFTELQDDEAYYWVYSRFLDWGYFDHPPMIAVLIKMGYAIFPNELGVRLLPLLLNTLSLLLIEGMLNKKNPKLFYAIALSIGAIQVSGFVAVPDIPLIFFTIFFFWCYRRFTLQNSLANTLLLGLSVALLMYSKYHAVLIVFFTLLSNLKLFTRYQTYVAGVIALALFMPHLWWQYQHDWVSFRYHLFESNVSKYKFSYTTEYIIGQLLLPGPIAGFIILPAAFLFKPADLTARALKFTMVGIYAFFLLSSFRGRVEGNWTSPVLASLIILAHQYMVDKEKWKRITYRLLPLTLVLVLFVRVIMIFDVLPVKQVVKRYHAWQHWPAELKEKTKGLPVVFSSSYQRASKYWFYTGQMAYSQNFYQGRKNNYNFWPIEDMLQGKPVYEMDIYRLERFPDSIKTPAFTIGYRYNPSFLSFAKIKIVPSPKKITTTEGATVHLLYSTLIPYQYQNYISRMPPARDTVRVGIFNSNGWIKDIFSPWSLQESVSKQKDLSFMAKLPAGTYYLRFAVNVAGELPTHNSDKIPFIIK